MRRTFYLCCLFIFVLAAKIIAQDTLPRITVKNISNKIIVSWKVTYGAKINTINIQRSADSLKNFTTIGSVLEPMNRENGFVDNKTPNPNMFYRVFVSFQGGTYIFTKSYRPVIDTSVAALSQVAVLQNTDSTKSMLPVIPPGKTTLPASTIPPAYVYAPSKLIYIGKENNVIIELHDATTAKYSIKFFDDKDNPVFEIRKVTEPYLVIEKVNFLHAGWFYFSLYDTGVLKEKNKFYIPKEGKVGFSAAEANKKY